MTQYFAPAGIDDFSRGANPGDLRNKWHDKVTGWLTSTMQNRRASPLFYDQIADTSGVADSQPQPVPWNGFPLRLTKWFGANDEDGANTAAEQVLSQTLYKKDGTEVPCPFRIQDEYCEWHVERVNGKIQRIMFTCEPPEYWEFLAKQDKVNNTSLVHTLYGELLHREDIPPEDLVWAFDVYQKDENNNLQLVFKAGDYNPSNKWNTTHGAIHLTHPANALTAEIQLASDSTLGWPVKPDAEGNLSEINLMACAGVGGINRSSDPLILKGVYGFASQGLSVALANPIGLYISPFTLPGLLNPNNVHIGNTALQFVRKSVDGSRILRAEVAPPTGAAYALDDCTLDGKQLTCGGQIARGITMRLFGVAKKIPGKTARKVTKCPSASCANPQHPDFRGVFPNKGAQTCTGLTADDWARETSDIPQQAPAHALIMAELARKRAKPLEGLHKMRGTQANIERVSAALEENK